MTDETTVVVSSPPEQARRVLELAGLSPLLVDPERKEVNSR